MEQATALKTTPRWLRDGEAPAPHLDPEQHQPAQQVSTFPYQAAETLLGPALGSSKGMLPHMDLNIFPFRARLPESGSDKGVPQTLPHIDPEMFSFRMRTTVPSLDKGVPQTIPHIDTGMFSFRVRNSESDLDKGVLQTLPHIDPELFSFQARNAVPSSNKGMPQAIPSIEPGMFPFQLRKPEEFSSDKATLQCLDPSTFPLQAARKADLLDSGSDERMLLQQASTNNQSGNMFSFEGRKSDDMQYNMFSEEALLCQMQQQSYQILKAQLSSGGKDVIQPVESVMFPCGAVKTELNNEVHVMENIKPSIFSFPSVTIDDKEDTPQVIFPSEAVKTELCASDGNAQAIQNIQPSIFPYETVSIELGSSKDDPQVIHVQPGSIFPYQAVKIELGSGEEDLQVIEHVQRSILPYQAVKIELGSNEEEPQVTPPVGQSIFPYQAVKAELCSGDEEPQIIQHVQRSILPYQAVKTELGSGEEQIPAIAQPAESVMFPSQPGKGESNSNKEVPQENVSVPAKNSENEPEQIFLPKVKREPCSDEEEFQGQTGSKDEVVVEEHPSSQASRAAESDNRVVVAVAAAPEPPFQKWNAEIMQQAVAAVRSGLMSSTGAAKHFNLPRTTLRRHLQPGGVVNSKMEGREPQCQKWNADIMDEAVAVVLSGQMSSTKAAKHYNLPRTTLRRYLRTGGVIRPPPKEQTEPEQFPCSECGRSFSKRSYLTSHMRTHAGEKLYNCEVCGKGLSHRDSLIMHLKTHTGERPFACEECGRCFPKRDHLTIHLRSHTGEKPFGCDTCGKSDYTKIIEPG